ncbi:MAG TPA: helix-turn-helix transcriptional regulator [Mycobacteriales bacterium]|nr:helix-turn-helix transcriptional regulator [Mycobacteriales bacterium]
MTEDEDHRKNPLGATGEMVADNVKRLRGSLSYRELSERLEALGRPIPPLGLSRIEKCTRRVDVDDLVALGAALGVPPVLLLYPVGLVEEVEVLPGRVVPTWNAAKWFTGEQPLASPGPFGRWGFDPPDAQTWETGAAPVDLYREHDRLISEWKAARNQEGSSRVKASSAAPDEEQRTVYLRQATEHRERAGQAEEQLACVRSRMYRFGLTPPALTDELADLDERAGSGRG